MLTFNGGAVAKAIDHARQRGCHVVTMSLGGTPSRAVKKAVKQAIQADMIVLAAAGNCVNLVVYPARYDEVIAVAGSNVNDGTWRGSCSGSAVDVTAPGEKVWKAVAGPDGTDVGGGQGTSFAVAITAGVAALWLSHHGHHVVKAAAVGRQLSVQALFREVLMASARVPAGWDTDDFGAGIVDAEAVLRHPLDGPSARIPEAVAGGTTSDTLGLLAEAWGPVEASRMADVAARPQLQLELSSVVFEDARLGVGPSPDVGAEGAMARQGISPELEAALGDRAAAAVAPRPTATSARASARASLRTDDTAAHDPVLLVAGRRSALESAGPVTVEAARESLRADSGERLGALEERVARVRENEGVDRTALTPLHDQLLRDGEVVLNRLREGQPIPKGTGARTALEALVQLDGRPALRLRDDGVDPNDPQLGDWQGAVVLHPTFATAQQSVGRIDAKPGVHVGTGFVVGEGLVMTNRHVLEEIGFPTPGRSNPSAWVLHGEPVVNFSPSGADPAHSFKVVEVAFSGPDPIDLRVDFTHLDLALLRVEQTNAQGAELPPALRLSDQAVAVDGARMFVVGYPALPTVLPTDSAGRSRLDVVQRLREIYGMSYGVRYLSPGLVMTSTEQLADNPRQWVFAHDATSLGGNSGSCVMSLDHDLDVAGLHFAGDWLRANYAHAMDEVRATFAGIVP